MLGFTNQLNVTKLMYEDSDNIVDIMVSGNTMVLRFALHCKTTNEDKRQTATTLESVNQCARMLWSCIQEEDVKKKNHRMEITAWGT